MISQSFLTKKMNVVHNVLQDKQENVLDIVKKEISEVALGATSLISLILILVEKKVFFRGIVGPDVFDAVINITLVLYFLKVLKHFKWSA